ncbi:4-hydroxy-tetrahydrodipicolinate synthase [Paucibacter sp. XJ19-41]|uniref:4-hydroxy-tetrahydrodipicolinate synthase n=1 Tax=Paucibacter sp. XJ19-41 TaxID=2927824 RepID=UPI00234BD4F5|nr:4-hydroxy-tetrahydrodipicolinate synthase [Paucibacter sp. XJ19-41]MDC6171362.1 4-hydroxy-tetrahydrodipicolinate synthase [Paucibacter sp. XJ19-41]
MSDNNYSGLWIPLVTPLHHDVVDHAALSQLVLHLKAQGVNGFVACGSTGEAALLDEHEQDAVLETVCEAAGGTPVMMGVSGPRPSQVAARMLAIAKRFPVCAFLLPAPSYIRPSQQGLLNFFGSIADVAPAPLVLYDIPYRTGVKIELPTLLTLAAHPNIEALKDCGGSLQATQALIADGRLAVLAGEDHNIFPTLALGGAGAIAASAHLHTAHFVRLVQALRDEQTETARRLWQALARLINLSFAESNPAPIKSALARLGRLHNELRAPLQQASPELEQRLWDAYGQAGEQLQPGAFREAVPAG